MKNTSEIWPGGFFLFKVTDKPLQQLEIAQIVNLILSSAVELSACFGIWLEILGESSAYFVYSYK